MKAATSKILGCWLAWPFQSPDSSHSLPSTSRSRPRHSLPISWRSKSLFWNVSTDNYLASHVCEERGEGEKRGRSEIVPVPFRVETWEQTWNRVVVKWSTRRPQNAGSERGRERARQHDWRVEGAPGFQRSFCRSRLFSKRKTRPGSEARKEGGRKGLFRPVFQVGGSSVFRARSTDMHVFPRGRMRAEKKKSTEIRECVFFVRTIAEKWKFFLRPFFNGTWARNLEQEFASTSQTKKNQKRSLRAGRK